MSEESAVPAERPVVVRLPVEPVESAVEADALDAAVRSTGIAVRGPLFGVATQTGGERWRVFIAVTHGCPQQARDELNSALWFRAKDAAKDRAERRALLAAVARLEAENVTDLTVLDTRYRVVRADEYANLDTHGGLETPRPTDPEPLTRDWSHVSNRPKVDDGLVLDPDAPLSPMQASERLAMRSLAYSGARFPKAMLRDSARALRTHPDIFLMPTAFTIVERSGDGPWSVGSRLHTTPHEARRALDSSLTWMSPRERGLIPLEAGGDVDARSLVAEGGRTGAEAAELTALVRASDELRAGRLNQIEVHGTAFRIVRTRRLVRWGPDGPESARPSDVSMTTPMALHPRLDEDGVVHFSDSRQEEAAS
ncbi:hypothetical protein E6R18_01870 [Streptomyces sp. A1277]|uniref:DUF5954 family protein n=1 Tax=Streptomyces sp. A1277 TaxID=2563103 RepID=UPI0010A22317|nr:DUF5954 family protein [Streptomyces sp. A1277]THA36113.1 hypothetical protein E6R18_01870 [Streptomyces sp. A1277]